MKEKKLFYVKREVLAFSIKDAATARGMIYEISLAGADAQPKKKTKSPGFLKEKN